MKSLPEVTLIGIDCLNIERLQLALDISCQEILFDSVKLLTSLPTDDPRAVAIKPITSIETYSRFCLLDLHQYVDTPYVLIVQHDGFILNPAAWQDSFLEYDYIGAPILIGDWAVLKHQVPETLVGTLVVGNGGFSLRSKELLTLTAKLGHEGNFVLNEPEDWIMCYTERTRLEAAGIRFAPVSLAEAFSFEGRSHEYYNYTNSFGFHSFRWTNITSWMAAHPEYTSSFTHEAKLDEYYKS